MSSIKIRAREKNGITQFKALIKHPMETGSRKDSNGQLIPAHYIREVVVKHGDRTVLTAVWGTAVSQNPYFSFRFKGGAKGDKLSLSWIDNKGESDSLEAAIE